MAMAFIPVAEHGAVVGRAGGGGLAAGIVNTSYQIGSALGSRR
jgi:hypothetical protein